MFPVTTEITKIAKLRRSRRKAYPFFFVIIAVFASFVMGSVTASALVRGLWHCDVT